MKSILSLSQKILQKVTLILVALLPTAIILSLLDYRFHSYFWPQLDLLRFQQSAFFDFTSFSFYFYILLIGICLIQFIFFDFKQQIKNSLKILPIWLLISIILAIAGAFIAELNHVPLEPVIKSPLNQILINLLVPIGLAVSLIWQQKTNPTSATVLKKSFSITFGLFALIILFEFVTNYFPGDNRDFLNRLVWPYIDPFVDLKAESANWLSYIFAPATLISIYLFKQFKKPHFLVSAVLTVSVLLLTKSYTGILAFGSAIGLYFFLLANNKWKVRIIILSLICLGIFVLTQWHTPKFQVLLGNYHLPNSLERRAQIYEASIKGLTEQPLTGFGIGNYQNYLRNNIKRLTGDTIPERELPPHPHNLILYFWSEFGLLGLISILTVYLGVTWSIISQPRSNAIYSFLLYPLIHGLFDVPYGLEEVSIIFWVTIAIVIAKRSQNGALLNS